MKLIVDVKTGEFEILSSEDKVVMQSAHLKEAVFGGDFGVSFNLQDQERFYGLGDTDREHLQHRGHVMRSWASYGQAYAPAPFIMSSNGWAVFVNTTFKHYYDVGKSESSKMKIWGEKGSVDLFLMVDKDYTSLLKQYTEITGKPRLLSQKAYGLMFVENQKVNQYELMEHAAKFRELEIPCDYLGLEPGWMETYYDPTVNINWDFDKFFMPASFGDRFRNKKNTERTFVGGLNRMGFDLSLWTNCEYDLTYEAERQAEKDFPNLQKESKAELFIPIDESNFDSRAHKKRYLNQNTIIDQPWFEHFKKFLNDGVRSFKQDPAYIINEHPDWHYGNGLNDDEMHNLIPPLYQRQVYDGWKEYLNERPMFYFCTGYAGVQHWAPTWAGDEGGRERALVSALNHSMTAHSNVTSDMDVFSREGIHFGFFQGWAQVNSWWTIQYPWMLGELQDVFKYYAQLRYRLMPYIYSHAQLSHQKSMPIIRAMPLMYPNDTACENLLRQYMFGEYFLVGAFTDKIYLPEGKWIDYWNGKEYSGNQEIVAQMPENRGGALFVKAGAIIPEWPYVDYVGQKKIDTMTVRVYPYKNSSFLLIEDEGEGFGYENGEAAKIEMSCEASDSSTVFKISKTSCEYTGMLKERYFNVVFNTPVKPVIVVINSKPSNNWKYDAENNLVSVPHIVYHPNDEIIISLKTVKE